MQAAASRAAALKRYMGDRPDDDDCTDRSEISQGSSFEAFGNPKAAGKFTGYHTIVRDAEARTASKYSFTGNSERPPAWLSAKSMPRGRPQAANAWLAVREANWDRSVRTYAPTSLKGLKPITLEHWATDAVLYECDHERPRPRPVSSPISRQKGRAKDVQAEILDEALGYRASIRSDRLIRQVFQRYPVEEDMLSC